MALLRERCCGGSFDPAGRRGIVGVAVDQVKRDGGFKERQHQEYSASNKIQNVTIAGVTRDGKDATNELSCLILEVCRKLKVPFPQIVLRHHDGLPDLFFSKVIEVNRDLGAGAVTMLNDKKIVRDLSDFGMSLEDSRIIWAMDAFTLTRGKPTAPNEDRATSTQQKYWSSLSMTGLTM